MKVLALNCGSSTVKFQLFRVVSEAGQAPSFASLARGIVERVGTEEARLSFESSGRQWEQHRPVRDHQQAIDAVLDWLAGASGVLDSLEEIEAVGHRVVHAGEYYQEATLIDENVARCIEDCSPLAPLHNPHNLKGYYAIHQRLPETPNVAVFDTAFHQTMPRRAYLYALPQELYRVHRIRRYGFHGTSHRYVAARYAELAGRPLEHLRLISCHLGSGSSMCAVEFGRSVDTSMGFTPLEGLVMGTRAGDLDPGILLYLLRQCSYSPDQLDQLLHHRSGLLGLSGCSNDVRVLLERAASGEEAAQVALEVFAYRVKKYIGAYLAVLNGADALVFTGGIGEHAWQLREKICSGMDNLGLRLEVQRNEQVTGLEGRISSPSSQIDVWVIPTNEELLIAREAWSVVTRLRSKA